MVMGLRIGREDGVIGRVLFSITIILAALTGPVLGQIESGSDGSDGVLSPVTNTVINMSDHPDGIYQYTSISITSGVTVTFIPNAENTPVVWLVQSNCVIAGSVNLDGQDTADGGLGGVGGYDGGHGGSESMPAGDGLGPGGGKATSTTWMGANASYGTLGGVYPSFTSYGTTKPAQDPPGDMYGNDYLVPLIGGSGGAGVIHSGGTGGGGGGAILIAASGTITINGTISVQGGGSDNGHRAAGGGSGGAVRLVGTTVTGGGTVHATGGRCYEYYNSNRESTAGSGRIRIDAMNNSFTGTAYGSFTFGYQPIILPPASQAVGLSIETVGGVAVDSTPTGSSTDPDVTVPANTQNPVTITVKCTNIPLNTEVIIDAKPANGASVRAAALNAVGDSVESYASVDIDLPRGAGTIQAKTVSGISDIFASTDPKSGALLARRGWLATGEHFASLEVISVLGGGQFITYLSESGKRYNLDRL